MRLIDADAPRKTLVDWLNWYKGSDSVRSIVREAVDILDETPTVYAEPVRHGRWTFFRSIGGDEYTFECSECNEWADRKHNYCPNCGAKMDGGQQDAE